MMNPPKILVVEDGVAGESVGWALRRENLRVRTATNGKEALRRYLDQEEFEFDLILLDMEATGMYGFTLCRELRAKSNVPVVMLSARDDETSIVVGLEVGADDYITKPFSSPELVSRVRARLRRGRWRHTETSERKQLNFPGLEIDLPRCLVRAQGHLVDLTAAQFSILALLASHPGRVHSREQIMEPIWGGSSSGVSRAADAHIQNIRKQIEPDPQAPRYIRTVRGRGYRFTET